MNDTQKARELPPPTANTYAAEKWDEILSERAEKGEATAEELEWLKARRRVFIHCAAHPLLFPDFTSFDDLFDVATSDDKQKPAARYIGNGTKEFPRVQVGPYCSVDMPNENYRSLYVQCKDSVLSRIAENMLPIEHDSFFFKVVGHENGKALVIVSHNVIIGSRWLAYIDAATVPSEAKQ